MQIMGSQLTTRAGLRHGCAVGWLLAIALLLAHTAPLSEVASAQGFGTYYGTDAANAGGSRGSAAGYSYNSGKNDPPYQSHFGASKPAGHFATPAPSSYEYGMDADSLYAAAAAQANYQRPIGAPAPAPVVYYYLVPEANVGNGATNDNANGAGGINTFAALTPGADWSFDYANFQDDLGEVPPLPDQEVAPGGDGEAPTFGQDQEEQAQEVVTSPLEFLRAQSVLLDKGERQIDVGLEYSIADGLLLNPIAVAQPAGPDVIVISTINARQRLLIAPIEFRYGLTDNIQVFCNIPFGWSSAELAIPGLIDEWGNSAGIGDVNCGATVLLHEGCGQAPDVIGSFAFTAPTGQADFFVTSGAPNSRLGEGFWAVSSSILFIQTLDPCVLFYGGGYRHRFDDEFNFGVVRANPGEQIFYQLGVGFAANESVTLTTSFLGAYITEDHVNGVRVQGGINEPMRLRFSATIAKPCKIVEPFAEIGMTRDSAAARLGITWTY